MLNVANYQLHTSSRSKRSTEAALKIDLWHKHICMIISRRARAARPVRRAGPGIEIDSVKRAGRKNQRTKPGRFDLRLHLEFEISNTVIEHVCKFLWWRSGVELGCLVVPLSSDIDRERRRFEESAKAARRSPARRFGDEERELMTL